MLDESLCVPRFVVFVYARVCKQQQPNWQLDAQSLRCAPITSGHVRFKHLSLVTLGCVL